MTIDSIIRDPEVGIVGVKATFRASGAPVGEPRFYLAYAPVNSALPTLETIAELPALQAADKSPARLQVENGAAYFTPDVPGHYQVECHDVTVTRYPRTWPGAPTLPDTDNDFSGAPVVTLNTAEGLSRYRNQPDLQVVETHTRTIGQAPNTLTFSLRMRDDIEWLLDDAVVIKPGPGALAQVAQYDDSILGVRDLMAEGRVRNNAADYFNVPHALLQADLQQALLYALDRWTRHLAETTSRDFHASADGVNTAPATEVTTLADALAQLAALRVAYNAHAASTVFHTAAENRNLFKTSLADPTDLFTGIDFARIAFQVMVYGASETDRLEPDTPGTPMFGHMTAGYHAAGSIDDAQSAASFDFSSSLVGLLRATNELTRLYNAHRIRVTQPAAHAALDSDNDIRSYALIPTVPFGEVPLIDTASAVTLVNELAECIERHTANLDRSGVPLTPTPPHQNLRPIKVGLRASNASDAIAVLEMCCAAMEIHALDGGLSTSAHASQVWGGYDANIYYFSGLTVAPWPLFTRAQVHLKRLQVTQQPVQPAHFNSLPSALAILGWKLRPHLDAAGPAEPLMRIVSAFAVLAPWALVGD